MKWLVNLFRSEPQEPELVHPLFGIMASYKNHDGSTYWQTYEDVQTAIGSVSVTIDGDDNGPSDDLIKIWQEIVADFANWKDKAEAVLRENLADFGHEKKFDELRIAGFGINTPGRELIDWDMGFELESEYFHYTVYFKDSLPTHVTADS